MIIKSIDLQNFRNYELQKIDFDSGTNILYGDNACGKNQYSGSSRTFIRHKLRATVEAKTGNDCI